MRFWKTVKQSLSDKVVTKDKISLSRNDKILKTKLETTEVLNKSSHNVIKNYEISRLF